MRYDQESPIRHWYSCLGVPGMVAICGLSYALWPWTSPLVPFVIFWLSYIAWCIATDKRWHLCVTDGRIEWDPFLGKRRSLAIADIEALELNLDDKRDVYARLKAAGKKKKLPISFGHDPEMFVSAVIAECPAVAVERAHRGST